MTNVDISPEAQRLLINLMLSALNRLNNRGNGGFGRSGGEIEDFSVSPELQGQFMNTLQNFAAGVVKPGDLAS